MRDHDKLLCRAMMKSQFPTLSPGKRDGGDPPSDNLVCGGDRFDLPYMQELFSETGVEAAIKTRRSIRQFNQDKSLTDTELAFLIWATQGEGGKFRPAPSAGARHAIETHLCIFNVEGFDPGFYHVLLEDRQLEFRFHDEEVSKKLTKATLGQSWITTASAVFIWTVIPDRMEWAYGRATPKLVCLDAGHICQNLYLACESIQAGTCAVAAYHQQEMDTLMQLNGKDELVIYMAPVGKK